MAVELTLRKRSISKHILLGAMAGLLIPTIYFGVVGLSMGLDNVSREAARLWYWITLLAIGVGVQVGLFSFIRQSLRERAAAASVGTSGGLSAGSMVACCAHHLSDLLPMLGLAGMAAFLANYQTVFILVGILSNAVGITIMLETIQRHGLCPVV